MARILIAADDGAVWVEITDSDDGYHGRCRCGEELFHHRQPDLIDAAEIHVDHNH